MSEPFHRRTVTQSSVSEPPTQPEGWYPTDGDSTQLRWWDGSAWTAHVATRAPGWYEHPAGSGMRVFFDGERWTSRKQRRATPTTLGWMSAIALLGTGVVVLGWRVATSLPAWSYPSELHNYYCFGEGEGDGDLYTGIGWLVAVWVLLVALCAASTVMWRKAGSGDPRASTLAILGIVTTVVLCPLWLVVGAVANCGM